MHIVVCLKQVPDTNNVKWTKENNLLREGMISILNPYDEEGLNCDLDIKKRFRNVKITAISMGPMQAKNVLEYALARGCDRAILLCDKAFAGSDTLATGTILANAIKKLIPDFDLIVCGQFALDGDTAQTGATIAGCLDIELASYVEKIINADKNVSILNQKYDEGISIIEVKNPSVACIINKAQKVQDLKIASWVRAQDIGVEIFGIDDIGLNKNEAGILGSPTFVSKAFKLEHNRVQKQIEKNICEFIKEICESAGKNE